MQSDSLLGTIVSSMSCFTPAGREGVRKEECMKTSHGCVWLDKCCVHYGTLTIEQPALLRAAYTGPWSEHILYCHLCAHAAVSLSHTHRNPVCMLSLL